MARPSCSPFFALMQCRLLLTMQLHQLPWVIIVPESHVVDPLPHGEPGWSTSNSPLLTTRGDKWDRLFSLDQWLEYLNSIYCAIGYLDPPKHDCHLPWYAQPCLCDRAYKRTLAILQRGKAVSWWWVSSIISLGWFNRPQIIVEELCSPWVYMLKLHKASKQPAHSPFPKVWSFLCILAILGLILGLILVIIVDQIEASEQDSQCR